MVALVILLGVVLVIFLFLIFYQFIFLRDPLRSVPSSDSIVAPADGKIISIVKVSSSKTKINKGLIGKVNILCSDVVKEGYLISIFMSVFNVHVNRAPLAGEILSIKHKKGNFFRAFDFEKSLLNESNEIIMKTSIGKVKLIQIAGFIARRIECFVKENQKVNKGQKIGRIVMGSQVSLILPISVKLIVKKGDKVRAGETIIAEK